MTASGADDDMWLVATEDSWVEMSDSDPSHSFDDETYTITQLTCSEIRICRGGECQDIDYNEIELFNNDNHLLWFMACNNIGSEIAYLSFAERANTNQSTTTRTRSSPAGHQNHVRRPQYEQFLHVLQQLPRLHRGPRFL